MSPSIRPLRVDRHSNLESKAEQGRYDKGDLDSLINDVKCSRAQHGGASGRCGAILPEHVSVRPITNFRDAHWKIGAASVPSLHPVAPSIRESALKAAPQLQFLATA